MTSDRQGSTPNRIHRRSALQRLSLWSALGLGLWPGCQSPKAQTGGRFQFLVVNDLHHASAECDPWFEALIKQMRAHRGAELALLGGDLADNAAPASLAAIRDHFRGLGRPFHAQIGNHDQAAAADRRAYEQNFPGQINYTFEHRGWQFVGIDTTQGVDWEKTRVQPATLTWLDDQLPRLDRRRPTVVFTHFPLGAGVNMSPLNSDEVLRRFAEFNLRGVFCGHYHAYTERQAGAAVVLTNRCCARVRGNHDNTKEKGYWLVTADGGTLSREFVEFTGPGASA
jgi:3',5'-cyclic AMP phosphodiesterase CpdA